MTNFGNTLQSVGGKMTGLGNTMTVGVTAPIVAGVGAVVKSAMSWESAFAGVKKTNDEVVDSNGNVVYSYADLENGLRRSVTRFFKSSALLIPGNLEGLITSIPSGLFRILAISGVTFPPGR